ncbi:MAG TPA: hypothetical protein VKV26_25020 [Dehalococcoidia bacterium]|nr:hypothetical protein [Dehalococcoidia bacterium]
MDDREAELERLIAAAGRLAPPELVARLVTAARREGARALFAALDAEGDLRPCGQGCGWEGPWALETTLWPADRERLLGDAYQAPAQLAEAEELARLRPAPRP